MLLCCYCHCRHHKHHTDKSKEVNKDAAVGQGQTVGNFHINLSFYHSSKLQVSLELVAPQKLSFGQS